jgi:TonB family protein
MKTCPSCGTSYSDDLSFCLQDGTKLPDVPAIAPTNRPTEVLRLETDENNDISTADTIASDSGRIAPPRTQFQMSAVEPATRMGCALTIGQVAAGLFVVIGLGFVGLLYTYREMDVARLEPTMSNKPSNLSANTVANGNFAMNTSATPPPVTASGTPKPVPGNFAFNTDSTPPPLTTKSVPRPISGGVLNGKAIELPQPPYPPAARAVRASGAVTVQVLIDEHGNVVSANAVSGHPLLRSAAVQAARSARFSPTLLGGQPVKVSGVINYNFVLQ